MAAVTIAAVQKWFGSTHVIRGVDIAIDDGEFCVLVGPSGCGKSTLLRMIAGLEEIGEGTIAIGGTVVNRVPPKERDIAMVFQNYALYPHMKVRDNMAFSLTLARRSRAEIRKKPGSKSAQPSRPFVAGNPVGIDIGTLETTTFHRAVDDASVSLSHASCSAPSIDFGRG